MHDSHAPHVDRYVPFKQEGWGIALFVVLLAVTAAGFATYVHKKTYLSPNDPHFHAAGTRGSGASHD